MTNQKLDQLLMNAFPEINDDLVRYMNANGDGLETGCFLTHEDVLHPFIEKALANNDKQVLTCIGNYIEYLLSLQNEYAQNIATVGIIEWLASEHANTNMRSFLGVRAQKEYDNYLAQSSR